MKYMELDGIRRNIARFKIDIKSLRNRPDGYVIDWLKKPWNMHHWVDIFVESSRAAPYLLGHWWSLYFPLSIIAIVWGWL